MQKRNQNRADCNWKYRSKSNEELKKFIEGRLSKKLINAIEFSGMNFNKKMVPAGSCEIGKPHAYLAWLGARYTGINYFAAAIKITNKKSWFNLTMDS